MIDINKLKNSDKGREVVYTNYNGKEEAGKITSWNKVWIFVSYDNSSSGIATTSEKLRFRNLEGK